MQRPLLHGLMVAACLVSGAGPVFGQAAAFIKFDGIPGGSTNSAHIGWSDLESFTLPGIPGAKMLLSKAVDKASPPLFAAATQNQALHRLEMEFVRSPPSRQRFYHFVFDSVRVLDFSHHLVAAAGSGARETLSIDFQAMTWSYVEFDANQVPRLEHTVVWDAVRGTAHTSREKPGLKVRRFHRTLAGEFQLEWLADAGKTYSIRRADTIDGFYSPWQQVTAAANGLHSVTVPHDQARRFFLIEEGEVVSN